MKKLTLSIVCLLAVTFTAIPAGAQTRSRCSTRGTNYDRRYDHNNRVYDNQVYRSNQVYRENVYRGSVYNDPRYNNNGYYGNGYYRNRSVWDRSRDKITTAAGAGGGALLGAVIGGRRGAVIGAITGGGAAALYTYGIRDKHNHRRF